MSYIKLQEPTLDIFSKGVSGMIRDVLQVAPFDHCAGPHVQADRPQARRLPTTAAVWILTTKVRVEATGMQRSAQVQTVTS